MNSRRVVGAATLAGVIALAGCGGSTSEPPTKGELIEQADAICSEANAEFVAYGARGSTPGGIALEFKTGNGIQEDRLAKLRALQPPPAVKSQWDAFIAAESAFTTAKDRVAAAARAGDQAKLAAAFRASDAPLAKRDAAAANAGFRVCGKPVPPTTGDTGTRPPAGAPKPHSDTGRAAAARYLAAARSGDCEKFNAVQHSDNAPQPAAVCKAIARSLRGARVVRVQEAGPVAQVEVRSPALGADTVLLVLDKDGRYHYGGDRTSDYGGLKPGPPDADAQDVADKLVKAVGDDDAKALDETVSTDLSPGAALRQKGSFDRVGSPQSSGRAFVSAIRADRAARPEQLIRSDVEADFLLRTKGQDWIVVLTREPGSKSSYRWSGWFPAGGLAKR